MATDHRGKLHVDHSLARQSFFVRNGKQTGVSVPGRQQRGDKYKKRSVNDIAIPDNALEMVEAEIMEDFAGNNGSITTQSSGGNVYPVGTT